MKAKHPNYAHFPRIFFYKTKLRFSNTCLFLIKNIHSSYSENVKPYIYSLNICWTIYESDEVGSMLCIYQKWPSTFETVSTILPWSFERINFGSTLSTIDNLFFLKKGKLTQREYRQLLKLFSDSKSFEIFFWFLKIQKNVPNPKYLNYFLIPKMSPKFLTWKAVSYKGRLFCLHICKCEKAGYYQDSLFCFHLYMIWLFHTKEGCFACI